MISGPDPRFFFPKTLHARAHGSAETSWERNNLRLGEKRNKST